MIAGTVMQTGAQAAMRVISKTLTDKYLKRANDKIFAPRGLRVRLMKTEALHFLVQNSGNKSQEGKFKSYGKLALKTAEAIGLHLPITGRIINRFAPPVCSFWLRVLSLAVMAADHLPRFSTPSPATSS